MKTKTLLAALAILSVSVDEHWTKDGAPALDHLSEETGEKVTRKDVTEIVPLLTRKTLTDFEESEDEGKQDPRVPADSVGGEGNGRDSQTPTPPKVDEELSELEQAKLELKDLSEEVAEFEAELKEANTRLDELKVQQAKAQGRVEGLLPRMKPHEMIKAARLAAAGEAEARIKRREAYFGGSPIDNAMRKDDGFGKKRPDFATPTREKAD